MVDQSFANRYRNLTAIGEGGMGKVFQADDTMLQKTVAIKVLTKTLSPEAHIRFQTEAKATARLNHPNIVRILDFGVTDAHEPYMVMDFLDGDNLLKVLGEQSPLPLEVGLQIFFQIAAALSHAHGKGIMHRDLKPSNVIVMFEGDDEVLSAKLVDFGIAKLFHEEQSVTSTGAILGSPLYMSPEQACGQPADARSDIYSMGCLMYECLSGEPPFRGASGMETMSMHKTETPAPLGQLVGDSIPAWLDDIVMTCLEKAPADRYQSVNELIAEMSECYERSEHKTASVDQAIASAAPALKARLPIGLLMILLVVSAGFCEWYLAENAKAPAKIEFANNKKREYERIMPREETRIKAFLTPSVKMHKQENRLQGISLTDDQLGKCLQYPVVDDLDLLSSDEITGSGLKHLIPMKFNTIRLRCELEDKYFTYIAQMKTLKYLKLDTVHTLDGSGFAFLKDCKNLNGIFLERCYVSNEALKNIAKNKYITNLTLKRAHGFNEIGLSFLRPMKLSVLDLARTDIDDKTLSGLQGTTITTLQIKGNPKITDKSLPTFKSINGLANLLFSETSISARGASRLAHDLHLHHLINNQQLGAPPNDQVK
jgi:tRNA A-37 threonylcarbamoyl transferase component Bud32